MRPEDVIFAQYREAGVFQQRGFTLDDFMSQLFANRNDVGKGRNMPVHYGSRKLNIVFNYLFFPCFSFRQSQNQVDLVTVLLRKGENDHWGKKHTISSPLATQIPQAAGAAYAVKVQDRAEPSGRRRVVACYFGEGAASEGDFHAGLNIAATRSCPVIFICRNNGYAISTPTLEQYHGDGIASRGLGYGIDTIRVDGNDIWAVREVTRHARRMALEGDDGSSRGRPILIEAMSYRVSHHSTSDDSFAYRARVEVDDWRRRDNPITRLRKYLQRRDLWDEDHDRDARTRIRTNVLAAFARAEKVHLKPPLRDMFTDVYEDLTEECRAQMTQLKDIIERYPHEYDVDQFESGKDSLV